jgi:hypothetical protein
MVEQVVAVVSGRTSRTWLPDRADVILHALQRSFASHGHTLIRIARNNFIIMQKIFYKSKFLCVCDGVS